MSFELYLGDCLFKLQELENESVNLILADPPYGQSGEYGRRQLGARTIKNDCNLEWLPAWSKQAHRVLKNNSHCVIFWQWRTYSKLEAQMLEAGFILKTVAVWDKCNPGLTGGGFSEQYEQICVFKKGKARQNYFRGNVFRYPRVFGRPDHPNEKPVDLLNELVLLCSNEGETVLDTHMGSGSTGVACVQQNRFFIGCEIELPHFELATERIQNESLRPKLFYTEATATQAEMNFNTEE